MIDAFPQVGEILEDLSNDCFDLLVTEAKVHKVLTKQEILEQLKTVIRNVHVRIGHRFYRQSKGIPQGSIFSTLLCTLYYGHFESEYLSILDLGSDSVLMRLIDDFLFISPRKSAAEAFLYMLHESESHPEYGFLANEDKIMVNFEPSRNHDFKVSIQEEGLFPWCGLLLDGKTLDVNPDMTRYFGSRTYA